jgi:hypothetical protein
MSFHNVLCGPPPSHVSCCMLGGAQLHPAHHVVVTSGHLGVVLSGGQVEHRMVSNVVEEACTGVAETSAIGTT